MDRTKTRTPVSGRRPMPWRLALLPAAAALAAGICAGALAAGASPVYAAAGGGGFGGVAVLVLLGRGGRPGFGRDHVGEAAYLRIFETTGNATVIAGRDRTIMRVNRRFEQLLGMDRTEVEGKVCLDDLLPLREREAFRSFHEHRHMGTDHSSRSRAFTLLNRAGEAVQTLVTVAPMPGNERTVASFTDVSERHALEERLKHAQKMEAVGRLAGGVAHDFNNLLTTIRGYTQFVLDELEPGEGPYGDIQEIARAAERATALTRQLLTFSRRQPSRADEIDLNRFVGGLETLLARTIGGHIDLSFQLGDDAGRVVADPTHVEQVLLNLVVNARDAMPGGGRLTVETGHAVLDASYAELSPGVAPGAYEFFSVSDTGVGMDAETRQRIFEPFYTTKPPGQGTGLGLSTVYGIVQQYEGHVSCYSEPGQGTVFKVYLPTATLTARAAKAAAPGLPAVVGERPAGTERIVVVEDDPALREVIRRILAGCGYDVRLLAPTEADLDAFAEAGEAPDLLLVDLVLPGISGPDLARRLGILYPAAAVVYMSGYSDPAVRAAESIPAGAHFVAKPFTAIGLARSVRQVLDAAVAEQQPA